MSESVSQLPSASSVNGADLVPINQGSSGPLTGNSRTATVSQIYAGYNVPTIVSAAGSAQNNATVLTQPIIIVTSVPLGSGVLVTSGYTKVWNAGVNTLLVYPPSGAQFELLGTNNPVSVVAGGAVETNMISTTQGYVRGNFTPSYVATNPMMGTPGIIR